MADRNALDLEKGKFTYHDGVAVAQLIFFGTYLFSSIYLAIRHWHFKRTAWFAIITMSILRIIGGGFQLATISSPTYTNYVAALVCTATGVAPLVLMNLDLVSRLNQFITGPFSKYVFLVFHLVNAAGTSLITVGGTSPSSGTNASSSTNFGSNIYTQVAVGILAGQYLATGGLLLYILARRRTIPAGEMRLAYCTAACAPFVVIRLVYAFLVVFAPDGKFEFSGGNDSWFLCLSVLPEIIACGLCIGTGLILPQSKSTSGTYSPTATSKSSV